jgi:Cu/Ag efflux protein CusF
MSAIRILIISASVIVASHAYAEGARHGTVTSLDEASGTITIQQNSDRTVGSSTGTSSAKFVVQDGLVFNALTQGDEVTYSSREISGVNTITDIQKR